MNVVIDTVRGHESNLPVINLGHSPEALTQIYSEIANIAVWQRDLNSDIICSANQIVNRIPNLQLSEAVTAETAFELVSSALKESSESQAISEDIAMLVDMFCCLFDVKRAGLRLATLNHAMCPRFHIDRVPVRLVTTYQGKGTEWLANNELDRSKLGAGNGGKSDEESGLFACSSQIQRLSTGDVALLKGELWEGNEGAGLVHRSPFSSAQNARLMLTLDLID